MQALLLNGAYEAQDATDILAGPIRDHLARRDVPTRSFILRDKNIAFCAGCFGCWTHNGGRCVIEDDGQDLADLARARDLIVLLTPVVFGGYGWELKKGLDRLLSIGVMAEEDASEASMFLSLLKRNAVNYHSSSYGSLVVPAGIDPDEFAPRLQRTLDSLEAHA